MKKFLLIIILLLASFFRLWQIGQNPAGFFTDEASNGINAYKIATTGRDDHDKSFPIIFEANGDYRDAVYIYSLVPFVKVFGLNEFSVRIVSALYGIGAVILIYFLAKEVGGEKIGLLSSFILAVSPWHVHFSRVGFQLITAVFWVLFFLLFLFKSLKKEKYYALSVIGMILAFFSYSTTKMYIFPLYIFFFFTYFKESLKLLKSYYFWAVNILSIAIVIGLILPHLYDGTFFTRWSQVASQTKKIKIVQSYLNHFSYDFLFAKGDANFYGQDVKRHSMIGMGELHYFQLPFLIVGVLGTIFIKRLRKKYLFFLFFLVLYPIGTIFTQLEPQSTRSILGIIPLTLFTSIGIIEMLGVLENSHFRFIFLTALGAVFSISTYILFIYLQAVPMLSAGYWGWQYGYRPIMQIFSTKKTQYDDLFITHRFNAGKDLLSFYKVQYDCENCSIMNNPIKIDTTKKQLFALRNNDILEASKTYPHLFFHTSEQVILPNGSTEIYIGEFREF